MVIPTLFVRVLIFLGCAGYVWAAKSLAFLRKEYGGLLSIPYCRGHTLETHETCGHSFSHFTTGINPLVTEPVCTEMRCLSY